MCACFSYVLMKVLLDIFRIYGPHQEKKCLEHTQNAQIQIISCMNYVSIRPLLSINPCPAEPRYALPLQTVYIQISYQLASSEAN